MHFTKSFTQQAALPHAALEQAMEVLATGRLHRYNTANPDDIAETALLEQEFSQYMGQDYCLACASGGYALHIALKAAGLQAGDKVLTNAFTLAPVPGAIHNAGGEIILVDVTNDLYIDMAHFAHIITTHDIKFFVMSHMRGHVNNMHDICALCTQHNIILIEDCAHTMGAYWDGKKSGTFGDVACFSTQTYKHLNSGEGGFLTTNNPDIMARAIIYSGSYMLYERHGTCPPKRYMDKVKKCIPNYSGRMDNLRATILRAQLPYLDKNCQQWTHLYTILAANLATHPSIYMPKRDEREQFVGSSIQFLLPHISPDDIKKFIAICATKGVEIKWFGHAEPHGFTSRFDSWHYMPSTPSLPTTLSLLEHLCDMRISLIFNDDDMVHIGTIIKQALDTL